MALPADDEAADVAVSNLAVAGAPDPGAAAEELTRGCCARRHAR